MQAIGTEVSLLISIQGMTKNPEMHVASRKNGDIDSGEEIGD